ALAPPSPRPRPHLSWGRQEDEKTIQCLASSESQALGRFRGAGVGRGGGSDAASLPVACFSLRFGCDRVSVPCGVPSLRSTPAAVALVGVVGATSMSAGMSRTGSATAPHPPPL